MKSAAILTVGIAALGLLAALCLQRHLPPSSASDPPTPANFHARVEHGMLILRGSLPSETSKAAILQRARELYGATPGNVDGNRAKATVLRDIAPLTQTGLELEDRILTGPYTAGRSTKASSPTTPS